ncbi:uncharacterized protein LOC133317924 [Gastrolobium bilobum]|uniref:uncharacterized protein LOC133317924 n=1 Tax=Gastrolobium bilobum TaxID=150636 RepID=UPI002AB2C65E|nr:uncharacterized protein LOC133317924 [Gastrolobium bilobum]
MLPTEPPHLGQESHEVHVCKCRKRGWPFSNPHPSAKHRRPHKKICGTIEVVEPKSMVGELESAEEDNGRKDRFPNVEERIGSIHKETKTSVGSSQEENTTKSTQDVKSKENKGTSTKHDAILYELVESQPDKKKSKDKSIGGDLEEVLREIPREKKIFLGGDLNGHVGKSNGGFDRIHGVTKPKSVIVKLESAAEEDNRMKDHFSDVEEGIRYSHNQTKTSTGRGRKVNTTKSTKAVKIKEGMHLPVVTIDKESENASTDKSSENNSDWPNNIEEAKQSEENQNLQGVDSHDLIIVEEKENVPMDVDKHEGQEGLDKALFAELDSILLEISGKSSAVATPSTSDVALHNIDCLLKNSLESIQDDVELQRQLRMSLECIEQASGEKVSPNVTKLVESMPSSIKDLFKDFTLTQKVVVDHTIRLQQKDELEQHLRDVKKRHELVYKEMSQCEFETERLDRQAKMLNENIRILVEQEKTVELKKAKWMETLERCDFERKKLLNEAKNRISERKELMSAIEKSKSSYDAALSEREKLNDKWEGFKTAFAENYKPPVSRNT